MSDGPRSAPNTTTGPAWSLSRRRARKFSKKSIPPSVIFAMRKSQPANTSPELRTFPNQTVNYRRFPVVLQPKINPHSRHRRHQTYRFSAIPFLKRLQKTTHQSILIKFSAIYTTRSWIRLNLIPVSDAAAEHCVFFSTPPPPGTPSIPRALHTHSGESFDCRDRSPENIINKCNIREGSDI